MSWLKPIVTAIIGAIVGAVATVIISGNKEPGYQTNNQEIQFSPTININVVSPEGKLLHQQEFRQTDENHQVVVKLSGETIKRLKEQAPQTEPTKNNNFFVIGLNNVVYSDFEHQIIQVKNWLKNEYSGYPSLLKTLKQVLSNRCPLGNPVPLMLINKHYLGDTSKPVLQHSKSKIIESFINAWKEKNSGSKLNELDKIAPVCN